MGDLVIQGVNTRKLNKVNCPHCESEEVVKYGFYKVEQRYRCKSCNRTFNPYTGTVLNWSHYKDKWGKFIETMGKDMSLRAAGSAIGIHYSTLFYWRHKVLSILNQGNENKLKGIIEMMKLDLTYLDKYHHKEEKDEELDFLFENGPEAGDKIHLTFLYQRDNRIDSFVYRDKTKAKDFIKNISNEIDKKSLICLNVNYPFRFPLLYNKFNVIGTTGSKGKKKFYYNARKVRALLTGFKTWMRRFHGVSSKHLNQYAAYYKTNKVFDTMEYIILTYLSKNVVTSNSLATEGDVLF